MTVTATHLIIHGRVQGMGYRNWAIETANDYGLNGWVRNRADGTVEMLLSGDTAAIAEMRRDCERGPDEAHVTRVDVQVWSGEIPVGFQQLETA